MSLQGEDPEDAKNYKNRQDAKNEEFKNDEALLVEEVARVGEDDPTPPIQEQE